MAFVPRPLAVVGTHRIPIFLSVPLLLSILSEFLRGARLMSNGIAISVEVLIEGPPKDPNAPAGRVPRKRRKMEQD